MAVLIYARNANTDGWGNKLVTIFTRHLDSFIVTLNLSLICQIRVFGSGHPDNYRDLQPRQILLSPVPIAIGMQKLRHTLITHRSFSEGGPCHRDSFSAKVPALIAGWLRQVTLTAHTRWQL
jgi:hypothetical protein